MKACNRAGPVMRWQLRCMQVCSSDHTDVANRRPQPPSLGQTAGWLLLPPECVPTSELTMTRKLTAGMAGVRRKGVTEPAGNLQHCGYINCWRGHIAVLDRNGLKLNVCVSYGVVKKVAARLLFEVWQRQSEQVPVPAS